MALIVETGTGSATSESYNSTADVDSYVTKIYGTTAPWLALSTTDKERYLRVAMQYLESTYIERWKGRKMWPTIQALAWPRFGAINPDGGLYFDFASIPIGIKNALSELAIKTASGVSLDPDDKIGVIESESVTVGPITTSKTYQGGKRTHTKFSVIQKLLAPYLQDAASRVYRA